MTMRVRVTLLATLATALAVVAAGWLLIRSVEDSQLQHLRDQAEDSLDEAADQLGEGVSVEVALRDLETTVLAIDEGGTCRSSNPFGGNDPFHCEDEDGDPDVIASGDATGTDDELGEPATGDDIIDSGLQSLLAPGASGFEMITRQVRTAEHGSVVLAAMAPTDTISSGIEAVGPIVWIVFPALVVLVAALAWWLTGRALRPVDAIRREAADIGASNIHRRVPEPAANDEIGRLARTMNAMLDRLDESARRQRQFVSDASHELRSPIAASRTDLEVALDEGAHADWPATARAVLAEQLRLDRLVDDLLVLAVIDESGELEGAVSDEQPVEIEPIVTEETARRRSVPVTLRFEAQAAKPVTVRISESHFQRALGNLLDNAARHATAEVAVTVVAADAEIVITVDDDGPGIPLAERERVFERFTRLDEGRDRDRGGTGLGLAVTRAVVERYQGTLTASTSPSRGARFTIRLPRS